ncbi:MAG TPA: hypothetical protein PL196_06370 [Burkholderiaceae bacterium]|nr:hypothetical protein [Burkholderiaceae bacterium]
MNAKTDKTNTEQPAPPARKAAPAARPAAAAKRKAAPPRKPSRTARPALAKPLSSEQLAAMFKLVKGATSVELKLSVPLVGQRTTIKSVGYDPVEAQPRMAYFFDTPDLDLSKAGVVVRARRIQGGEADTVIKLRPVDPSTIDPELRRSAAFKIEVDAMPGGFVCSASFKGVCSGQEVVDVEAGAMPLRKLFSKEQRAFYDAHAPAGLTMDKLVILGPTFLLKLRHQPKAKDFDRPIVLELWLYPDGSRIMEISTKCQPKETFQIATDFKAYLADRGIELGADQSAKTRSSLEFFSARLKAEAGQGA